LILNDELPIAGVQVCDMDINAFKRYVYKNRYNLRVLYAIVIYYALHLKTSAKDLLGCGHWKHSLNFEIEDVM